MHKLSFAALAVVSLLGAGTVGALAEDNSGFYRVQQQYAVPGQATNAADARAEFVAPADARALHSGANETQQSTGAWATNYDLNAPNAGR